MKEKEPIIIFTDGACSGNPGPAGIGGVLKCGKKRKEFSEFIGESTNSRAELMAVFRALSMVKDRKRQLILHVDSEYTIKSLKGEYRKLKKNLDLIEKIRDLMLHFDNISIKKVDGHRGIEENERADFLARSSIIRKKG